MKRKLAIALDLTSREEFKKCAAQFSGLPIVIKVGLRLLPRLRWGGTDCDLKWLKQQKFEVFIDAKLHDIPSQVGDAVKVWADLGADYLTLHLSGGAKMLEYAVREQGSSLRLLGVSVLTSMGADDLKAEGWNQSVEQRVAGLCRIGAAAGMRGFVSSVAELAAIRSALGPEGVHQSEFCTPGLFIEGSTKQADQSRSYSLEEACKEGATLAVLGRAILAASEPRVMAQKSLAILQAATKE